MSDELLTQLNKDSNKRADYSTFQMASDSQRFKHISTGSFVLDMSLLGGFPKNVGNLLIGKQHSGKTLTAFKTVGNYQKEQAQYANGKKVLWVNMGEGMFPSAWAAQNGVDIHNLYLMTPPDGDVAGDLVVGAMQRDEIGLLVFDAIPGIVSLKELEKSVEDANSPGYIAVPLQKMLRKLIPIFARGATGGPEKTALFINQWRVGISSAPHAARTMPGGQYQRHFYWTETELFNKGEEVMAAKDGIGVQVVDYNEHAFKNHKNKVGNSIKEGEFQVVRRTDGMLPVGTVLDHGTVVNYAQKYGLVGGAGQGWWMIDPGTGEELKFKGKGLLVDHVVQQAIEDENWYVGLKRMVLSKHREHQGLIPTDWYD